MACVGGLIFKHKHRTPAELVHRTHDLLLYSNNTIADQTTRDRKREDRLAELGKLLLEIRNVLYGDGGVEPNPDACLQVTKEFFSKSTLRLLIQALPKLDLGTRQNATHVIANLQRQKVNSRLIACEYLEANLDLMDILIPGYEDGDIALTYGAIARECIRHQIVAKYVLESEHMNKFFDYLQIQNFDIASDVLATYKELLTRHKSTVAEFLSSKYDWFFPEYNRQLLESSCYIIKRHAIQLLGAMLLDRSNTDVMIRYVSSADNMRIMMNLLRDSNKMIKLEAFHVFKLFVANQNKPPEIIRILITNKTKLLRFFEEFNIEKEDEKLVEDKEQVIQEIASVELPDRPCPDSETGNVQSRAS